MTIWASAFFISAFLLDVCYCQQNLSQVEFFEVTYDVKNDSTTNETNDVFLDFSLKFEKNEAPQNRKLFGGR